MINTRFGCLTVIGEPFVERRPDRTLHLVKCLCDCGKEKIVARYRLLSGHTSSCGHLRGIALGNATRKHGKAKKVPEYQVWKGMRKRCNNPREKFYSRYGGRGITICPEWDDFGKFYEDMGQRPTPHHKLERKNNDGNYCKENCKWATQTEQACNRASSRFVSFGGETHTISEWSRKLNVGFALISDRLNRGWSAEKALTEPVRTQYRKG